MLDLQVNRLVFDTTKRNALPSVRTNYYHATGSRGNDATGNVINIQSNSDERSANQHGNATFNKELDFILKTLEGGKGNVINQLKEEYKEWDKTRSRGLKSSVN